MFCIVVRGLIFSYLLTTNHVKLCRDFVIFLVLEQSSDNSWSEAGCCWGQDSHDSSKQIGKFKGSNGPTSKLSQAKPRLSSKYTLHIGTSLCWPLRAQQFSEHHRAKEHLNLVLKKSTGSCSSLKPGDHLGFTCDVNILSCGQSGAWRNYMTNLLVGEVNKP